jgi:hypothetical protein
MPLGIIIDSGTPILAACEKPLEYSGRIFWAERELEELGIEPDAR